MKPVEPKTVSPEPPAEEFAPMPKAKVSNGEDIFSVWESLLSKVKMPAHALLKQWAKPVKLSPEEVVILTNLFQAAKERFYKKQLMNFSRKLIQI